MRVTPRSTLVAKGTFELGAMAQPEPLGGRLDHLGQTFCLSHRPSQAQLVEREPSKSCLQGRHVAVRVTGTSPW